MARTPSVEAPVNIPAELVAAVTCNAEQDAQDVARFLKALGIAANNADTPIRLPASLLLGLGAALQLLRWESQGLQPHMSAGLPTALEAIKTVFLLTHRVPPATRDPQIIKFFVSVFRIATTRFAWEGQSILGADVLLGEPDEDALIEAVAQFVWQTHRKGKEVNHHGHAPSHN